MPFQSTITRKGQLTIPKDVREFLGLRLGERVLIDLDKRHRQVKITPLPTLEELAGSFRVKSPSHALVLRKKMERAYARV
jgi:AbrB family looped-hinge helix DNA binding protein